MEEDIGILRYIRGVDFSKYKFEDIILSKIRRLENIRWIKLNSQQLSTVPDMSQLLNLEYLSLSNNSITSVDAIKSLCSINALNLRRNRISNGEVDISDVLFETNTLDLSYNELESPPEYIELMRHLIMLNISNNKISSIDKVLAALDSLTFLDVSNNILTTICFNTLKNIQHLNISNNPILLETLEPVFTLTTLRSLILSNINMDDWHLTSISSLRSLTELDISMNNLSMLPHGLFKLKKLQRLNVSNNRIFMLPDEIAKLIDLRFLNVSFNQLTAFSKSIVKLKELRRLFANGNAIVSTGLPSDLNKLTNLEILMLAFNELDTIPPSLCQCPQLKRLILRNNKLLTLPETIHDMPKLESLDTKGNPDFVMPRKPIVEVNPFSKMDFSYQNVRNMVFTLVKQQLPPQDVVKEDLTKQKIVVKKKTHIDKLEEIQMAEAKKAKKINTSTGESTCDVSMVDQMEEEESEVIVPKPPISLLRPNMLEFTDIFSESIQNSLGLSIFLIENFSPTLQEDNCGTFFDGDCYVILNSAKEESVTKHYIYYWIGSRCSIDKQACAAMHAVNLRGYLGSCDSTHREEQDDESIEFKSLFPLGFTVQNGESAPSALFDTKIKKPFNNLLYRISIPLQGISTSLSRVPLSFNSLDPRFVFLLITKSTLFLWYGQSSKKTLRHKASLLADKYNKHDRKNECKILHVNEDDEDASDFWSILGGEKTDTIVENKNYDEVHLKHPVVYKLMIGSGYVELPQVHLPSNHLTPDILQTDSIYIIDCWDDIFVWFGKQTTKIVRQAALRLAVQIQKFFNRPIFENVHLVEENQESFILKTYFYGWNDVLPRSNTSLKKPDVKPEVKTAKKPEKKLLTHEDFKLPKMDVVSIFLPRAELLSDEHCQTMLDMVDDYLESMDCYIFDNKKFVKMPIPERGQFYTDECYVFLCKTVVPIKDPNPPPISSDPNQEMAYKMEVKYRVFFWEGRKCHRTGYLTFAFSLQKQFERAFGNSLTVERVHQQQEPYEFLALFHPNFIIHRGLRPSAIHLENDPSISSKIRLYEVRSTMGFITLRCIEIDLNAELLCSKLCYILSVPDEEEGGSIYLWIGKYADESMKNPSDSIAQSLGLYKSFTVITVNEGKEPEEFWTAIGGKKPYDTKGLFLDFGRLFRCSNELGYYGTKEKYLDFCQDDLVDGAVMMLDNGCNVYLREGSNASDIEVTLSRKIASTYIEHCKYCKFGMARTLAIIKPGEEPLEFRRVFQGFTAEEPPAITTE